MKGRKAKPAFSGPYPSTRWMYSVLKKNIANMPEATRNMTMFAVVSDRTRKIDRRTSGDFVRISISTNDRSTARDHEETEGDAGRPAVGLGLDDRVDE